MPGPLVPDGIRDLLALQVATKLAEQYDDLDSETVARLVRETVDSLQADKVVAVQLPDADGNPHTMQVADLYVAAIDEIAKKYDVGWLTVTDYALNAQRLGLARDVVLACAKQLKLPAPRGLNANTLTEIFTTVDKDVHDEEGGGSGPLPISDGDET